MLKEIKKQLLRIIDDIDCGNSDVTEEEELEILECLQKLTI